jgi:hypothetical protein
MNDVTQALALLETEKVMTLVPAPGTRFRSLVGEVTGGPVKGSWWGHEKGKVIYRIASELEASGVVLTTKLVKGRVTFVHRALWPALLRVVTDPTWRNHSLQRLPMAARKLLEQVEAQGRVRMDGRTGGAGAKALEEHNLVVAGSEHTETGAHATVLTSWTAWAQAAGAVAAPGSVESANAILEAAGIGL